jgi:polysaccharide pyruvyl transferase WcaK-like protein
VRSSDSASSPLLSGLAVTVDSDPAFSYLATRTSLDRLESRDQDSADQLLAGTENAILVGINLRPVGKGLHPRGAVYQQQMLAQFMRNFADGLVGYAQTAGRPVIFIYFPMNSIQFGMSDLTSACELQRAIGDRAEMRVWQADPQVDGILYLLRRLDATVVMRLHAAIFSLSLNLPVLGIDFFNGMDSKLAQLFADRGIDHALAKMEHFDPEWLKKTLEQALT